MGNKPFLPCILLALLCSRSSAQGYNPAIDILHYDFSLELNDSNNNIRGEATITLSFNTGATDFSLDLNAPNADGKGMTVSSIREGKKDIPFTQGSEHLHLRTGGSAQSQHIYTIHYQGIPIDGLIISNNKFGRRGFFGDNWPNRAHNWLPCVDHPSDKATVDFHITAPDHYTVVANGALQSEETLARHRKRTTWKEASPLSPKIMVIGVADFSVDHPGDPMGIPVYNYVFTENKKLGFDSYAVALKILPFYISHIGPYPFEKEGNVQSKTRFGGLENASAIFYYENSVGSADIESLMAHEIAHQWFGDAATESQWKDLWLSEGFATYMTLCYLENRYGPDTLARSLVSDRKKVIAFERTRLTPIVDTSVKGDYMVLLNPNSYEKGGWVLHMLRRKLGDSLFWKGISAYYSTYRNRNASSADLQNTMETVSGQNLKDFFHQWLDQPGHPHLSIAWQYHTDKKTLFLTFQHTAAYSFPLDYSVDGVIHRIDLLDQTTTAEFPCPQKPTSLIPDPNTDLLADFDVTGS